MKPMAADLLAGVDRGDLLEPEELKEICKKITSSGATFTVEGSLHDHMIDEYPVLMEFEGTGEGIRYEFDIDWPVDFPEEKIADEREKIRDSFIRAGVAQHLNLEQVMAELRRQDDVILGIDRGVLRDCVMTSELLDEIYAEPFPNWILIVIPRLVMNGIELDAKSQFTDGSHPRVGWPTYSGRIGQRALQELRVLREADPNRPGLSIMTVGELSRRGDKSDQGDWRSDAFVRDQFHDYLDDIGFRKGAYFISQSQVDVMMAGTEGGNGIHLQKPGYDDLKQGHVSASEFASLIHELCVQFGAVRFESRAARNSLIELNVYWPGKQVGDWEQQRLNVVTVDR
jgi:hypothetical protein